ncbi:hypothetical protein BDY19DRAFT_993586 [Irpex rosettiformis]|uniref:Uncharacterized protein n=1 Tax=Irpex rosettiformis TaxID=378272 RepID=A0ACB8U3H0_9APHY|nr:hypothetical protein BDY19DRAFT_993586 [Irpex rosettiformis]
MDPQATQQEPKTKYVLAGQPTGWAAMAKDVREFDEEKVRSSKEDVDTLLVFAGLFSAVLTAFLVASYPNPQPSPMAIMNYDLERIAMQTASYNFSDGKLVSSTILSSSLPPFQASNEDIRVNILWFTSLTLSLMTASFGMLVKQWLREFLAVEVPPSQACLRIRHFREPQIQKWRVYEIVACLPLLLQLSLALFFLGLCYFASSVHESVGHTTLPLVVGWALCFFGATALPIFFPRCPYQTNLLKTAISFLHRPIRRLAARIRSACTVALEDVMRMYEAEYWRLRCGSHYTRIEFEEWFGRQKTTIHERWLVALESVSRCISFYLPDEQLLVDNPSFDVDILVAVDAIQADDETLGTTIREALQYILPEPKDAILFIMQILAHRAPPVAQREGAIPEWPFDVFVLRSLRSPAKTSIMKILADYVDRISPDYSILPQDNRVTDALSEKLRSAQVSARFILVISALTTEEVINIRPDIIQVHLRSCAENSE